MTESDEFAGRTDRYRPELLAHCYRMLGSIHDAEDALQETLVRAWRFRDRFDEGRAPLRTWLHRIATNACLRALEQRDRRPLPSALTDASRDGSTPLDRPATGHWLQPAPDALFGTTDPATIVATRGSVRLAMIAALQQLPARQRAVLLLRDVLGWRAGEVAELLDTTTASVTSALQRARTQLARAAPGEDDVPEPADPADRALVDRYVDAFVTADVTALSRLLAADVTLEMPPYTTWFAGRDAVGAFLADHVLAVPGAWRLVRTRANGQPAVATYHRARDGRHRPHSIQVLTLRGTRITRIIAFQDPTLFPTFGLPPALHAPQPDRR